VRDVLLVARFEVLRAIRTWRALALLVLFGVASAGASYLFVKFVGLIENAVAEQMGVPKTKVPGTMLQTMVASDTWREVVEGMVGADHLVEFILQVPPLAMFHLWFGLLLAPFFAASASAECLAIDVQSRAIRYEALRTGRTELVAGRFLGQVALTGAAIVLSIAVVWGVGVGFMVLPDRIALGAWLAWFSLRAWAFSIPFVGIGVAASQITSSPAWARVIAVGGTAGTWVAYGVARWAEDQQRLPIVTDVTLQLLPQGWMRGLWEPGAGWIVSAVAVIALGGVFAATGYLRFARRDL
jgi:hypothetical protein